MEQTTQLYTYLSYACFIMSGVLLIVAIVLWFVLRIPKTIGYLSGHTAQKAIAKMQKERQKGEIKPIAAKSAYRDAGDGRPMPAGRSMIEHTSAETTFLNRQDESKELGEATQWLGEQEEGTELLLTEETSSLADLRVEAEPITPQRQDEEFQIFDSVTGIHTDEVIE